MLTGRRFRIENPTLALDKRDGKQVAITIPAGSILTVVTGPAGESDGLVDVVWDGQTVSMFAYDLNVRGTEIKEPGMDPPVRSKGQRNAG